MFLENTPVVLIKKIEVANKLLHSIQILLNTPNIAAIGISTKFNFQYVLYNNHLEELLKTGVFNTLTYEQQLYHGFINTFNEINDKVFISLLDKYRKLCINDDVFEIYFLKDNEICVTQSIGIYK